jgi:hypothetical protein
VLGELEITVTPSERLSRDTVQRYADLGVQRLVLYRRAQTEEALLAFIRTTADTVVGRG